MSVKAALLCVLLHLYISIRFMYYIFDIYLLCYLYTVRSINSTQESFSVSKCMIIVVTVYD